MSDDLISEEMLYQNIDKIKASSAEIVVHGTKEKPYYEIEYFDLSDNEMHIGFSSYKLDVVFGYLEKYFDIVDNKSEHGKCESPITGDLISRKDLIGTERLLMTDIVESNKVARYILEQILHDIEHAPTVFDKEKVKQELEISSKLYSLNDRDCEFAIPQNIALEIVEKGGI